MGKRVDCAEATVNVNNSAYKKMHIMSLAKYSPLSRHRDVEERHGAAPALLFAREQKPAGLPLIRK